MDIQRTRTVSVTGTGRQFDTRQRHQITAVVDKTQFYCWLLLQKTQMAITVTVVDNQVCLCEVIL